MPRDRNVGWGERESEVVVVREKGGVGVRVRMGGLMADGWTG